MITLLPNRLLCIKIAFEKKSKILKESVCYTTNTIATLNEK
ncbi:unnamed protein product [Rotaria sordida]|uniref:Uncharacterized protein n=1 Tax=Rotaria sordida TaxID=392033 RepID=A0A815Q0Q4_9BILA|nr:unnamed protein product [Rotaria sordida]